MDTASHAQHRPLTSIRGVAALWVAGSHLPPAFAVMLPEAVFVRVRGGFMGVDLFFVLSGFILALVYQSLTLRGVPRFLLKRAARVYPLNVFLTLLIAVCALGGDQMGVAINWHALPVYLAMVQPYLRNPPTAWITTNWSVGVELGCYLVFPLLVLPLRRRPWPVLVLACLGASGAEYWVQHHYLDSFAGLGAVWRGLGGFGLGVSLGALAPRLPRCPTKLASLGEAACLAGIWHALPDWGALWQVPLFSAGLILFLFFDTGVVARVLRTPPLFWLGEISFSLYLLHGPLLGRYGFHAQSWAEHMPPSLAYALFTAAFFAVVLPLSWLTWRCVEQPGRRLAGGWARRDGAPLALGAARVSP